MKIVISPIQDRYSDSSQDSLENFDTGFSILSKF